MASLRRNRTMPTDGAISKFLYTILKQLDLKSIDWQEVADQLDITNGHAARMRFSRFKQQMEGIPPAPRKPRPVAPRQRKTKPDKRSAAEKKPKEGQQSVVKGELGIKLELGEKEEEPMQGIEPNVKPEPVVKEEPSIEEPVIKAEPRDEESGIWSAVGSINAERVNQKAAETGLFEDQSLVDAGYGTGVTRPSSPGLAVAKQEPVVKSEPMWED